jgi:hypothetical protein
VSIIAVCFVHGKSPGQNFSWSAGILEAIFAGFSSQRSKED